jgi:hypothetical protein
MSMVQSVDRREEDMMGARLLRGCWLLVGCCFFLTGAADAHAQWVSAAPVPYASEYFDAPAPLRCETPAGDLSDGPRQSARWDVIVWIAWPQNWPYRGSMLSMPELPNEGRGALNVVYGYQRVFRGTSNDLQAMLPLWSADEERVFLSNEKVGCYRRMAYVDRADGTYVIRDRREGRCGGPTSSGASSSGDPSPTPGDPAVTEYVIRGQCTRIPYKSARSLL